MEDREIVVLEQGVTAEEVAAAAACCSGTGAPTSLRVTQPS